MAMKNSGDRLASGQVRASFCTTGGGMKDQQWQKAVGGFDATRFAKASNRSMTRNDARKPVQLKLELRGAEVQEI
jgi:hypothetical protein